jgi:voltage-gated potassium channel Kch
VAEEYGLSGVTVAQAERALGARVLAVDGATDFARDTVLAGEAELVVYGEIATLQASAPSRGVPRRAEGIRTRLLSQLRRRRGSPARLNPILARLGVATLIVFLLGISYFHSVFGGGWLDAIYFVIATMTTTGYGDLTPDRSRPDEIVAAMLLMLCGIVLTGLFIAYGASLLTRIQWVTLQGLRPVYRHGHIVVCGAGSIGTGVIDLLLGLNKRLVVIERSPDAGIVERAQEQQFDLLTGDASRDTTLDLCNLEAAHGLVALTNVDTLNLEIALGARARNSTMPIVLRIAEATFAQSIARHFEFETTFSASALAAPAFVGLSRFPGSRGRVSFSGQEYAIGETEVENFTRIPPLEVIPLAVSRGNQFEIVNDRESVGQAERILMLVPIAPFREGKDTLAAAAERFLERR